MIVEYLRYTIPDDQQAEFRNSYDAAHVALMQSPYALGFELCQCVDDPAKFIVQIRWTSAEDHLKRFRQSAEFRAFLDHIRQYVPMLDEMRHYETLVRAAL